jgi:hypothetical protein
MICPDPYYRRGGVPLDTLYAETTYVTDVTDDVTGLRRVRLIYCQWPMISESSVVSFSFLLSFHFLFFLSFFLRGEPDGAL